MNFVQGLFIKNNALITVVGSDDGYKYHYLRTINSEKPINIKGIIPIIILDLSYSMYNSNSVRPALDSTKYVCQELFKNCFEKVLLIIFGKKAINIELDKYDYSQKISHYNISSSSFLPWEGNQTCPTEAFKKIYEYLLNNKYEKSFIIFMTDGEFNGTIDYPEEWKKICNDLSKLNIHLQINSIGYQNDNLSNIKTMKSYFDSIKALFTYKTIKDASEISNGMKDYLMVLNLESINKIYLDENVLFEKDDLYSKKKYFDKLEEFEKYELADILKQNTEYKGVSKEWIKKIINLEIYIGLIQVDSIQQLNNISKLTEDQKGEYKKLFGKLIIDHNNIKNKYLELRNEYKSIKSRNISVWKSLIDIIEDFTKLIADVQDLINEQLNEKRSFEISTRISNCVSTKHLRTLQRRKIYNEQQIKEKKFDISLIQRDPLKIKCEILDNDKVIEKVLDSNLKDLNNLYTCVYTLDQWEDLLNTIIGVPIFYKWKENDDWCPGKAYIESVSVSNFFSVDGYKEMQTIFGNVLTPEHQLLYGERTYVKSGHDEANAIVPIATDCFFLEKIDLVKERLGHMISGSNMTFSNRHILFYVSVIKQAFYQLLVNNTEKMRNIILLLLNTFKLLTDNVNTIFDKTEKPLTKWQIIVEIAKGNTAPYLFSNGWESAIFCLTTSDNMKLKAFEEYQKIDSKITYENFNKKLWEMILRHFKICLYERNDVWENPKTWGLLDADVIEKILIKEGHESLIKYLMTPDKVSNIPELIKKDLEKIKDKKFTKIFRSLLEWSEKINDDMWIKLNNSFVPFDLKAKDTSLTSHFTDELIGNIHYWAYLECFAYGQKDCYPKRSEKDISRIISNKINDKYGGNIAEIFADVKEKLEYKQRQYETRFLPITFTAEQGVKLNKLFDKVYNGLSEQKFKLKFKKLVGNYYSKQFDIVLNEDGIDVLKNLYEYRKKHNMPVKIKASSHLPYSCPANASSPLFLQNMTDSEFSAYYKPVGFGYSNKKYKHWYNELHVFMTKYLDNTNDEDYYVKKVIDYINSYRSVEKIDLDHYKAEISHFFNKFKDQ